jgi:hypothetical protein
MDPYRLSLFAQEGSQERDKRKELMATMDKFPKCWGNNALQVASLGFKKTWKIIQ